MEFGESFEQCGARELWEETGITVECRYWTLRNVIFAGEGRHYVTIFLQAELPAGATVRNCEPEKCEGWQWYSWEDLPAPLMPGIAMLRQDGCRPQDGERT